MMRIRLEFTKAGEIRWLSHLELSRAWQRLIVRCGLPLAYTAGFSPHPKIALAPALPVGVGSTAEYADLVLSAPLPVQEILTRLNSASPAGLKVGRAKAIAASTPTLGSAIKFADYRLTFKGPQGVAIEPAIIRLPIETKLNEAIASAKDSILPDLVLSSGAQPTEPLGVFLVDRVAQFAIVEDSLVDPIEAAPADDLRN